MVEFNNKNSKSKLPISEDDMNKVLQLIKAIRYGSVNLVIQDGVVIQIETSEKIRLK